MRKAKTFTALLVSDGVFFAREVLYLRSFRVLGETFVVRRPIFADSQGTRGFSVSHRDTGAGVGLTCRTQAKAISQAIEAINRVGKKELARLLRRAKNEIALIKNRVQA